MALGVEQTAWGTMGLVMVGASLVLLGGVLTAVGLLAWVGICLWKGWWPW